MKSLATFRALLSSVAVLMSLSACMSAEPDDASLPLSELDPVVAIQSIDCADPDGPCVVSGSTTIAESAEGGVRAESLPSRYAFWALQLNLCNSGLAGCYENGASVPEAATVIRNNVPDVVTLNEICQNDVITLHATLASVYPNGTVVWAFKAAGDRRTGGPYKCKNGQDYGIGVIAHIPTAYAGYQTYSGLYASQDTGSAEQRAWLCINAVGNYFACTTHLASTSGTIALNQCNQLMRTEIPAMHAASGGARPTVMAGDLNLRYGGSPNAQSCVPGGWYRKGDGSVQHSMMTSDLTFVSTKSIGMSHTDHPGWLVKTTAP